MKSRYETEEAEADMLDDHGELEDEDANMNSREPRNMVNDQDDAEENAQDFLAAAGLEDSDAEVEVKTFSFFLVFDLFCL